MSIADVLADVIGSPQLRVVSYDGSSSGSPDAPVTVSLRSELALRYLASSPGELGLARAYVTGELDIHGDLYEGLRAMAERPSLGGVTWSQKLEIVRALGPSALRPVPLPPQEVVPGTRLAKSMAAVRRHAKVRDAAAISHHYDVSNRSTRGCSAPRWRTRARSTRPTTRRSSRRSTRSSTSCAASSTCSPGSGCSTSAAAGAAWSATR